ncbi:arginine--tRNA ligase [Mycoplasma elephantis]|uniref:arginine--tRNA ligase n=1 Tax=Mycoplasma elephantis TaxID=114882 RepID=UPI00048351D9|nr:arginine--tRNA ligase [Mycoplasma elephantis]
MNIQEQFYKLLKNGLFEINSKLNIDDFNFIISEPRIPFNENVEKIEYDLSTNFAMVVSKKCDLSHEEIAKIIYSYLIKCPEILKVSITSPGFINVKFKNSIYLEFVNYLSKEKRYGSNQFEKLNINNEFVSVNPTGYLHAGHARNAIVGSVLSNVMKYAGYNVTNEYYINDAGNQINILCDSAYVRYQNLFKINSQMPEECYKGNDIIEFAKFVKKKYDDYFLSKFDIKRLEFKKIAVDWFMNEIRKDLKKIKVSFDIFTSEKSLFERNLVLKSLDTLSNFIYEKDGAKFLQTTKFGDDKDRVLVKKDGSYTYFLSDIAYHLDKAKRADKLINVWGADHSGYIKRIENSLIMNNFNSDNFHVVIIQLVRLIKDGKEFKMSKRNGTSLTIRDLLEYVSIDALRYNLSSRDSNTKMDLDIDQIEEMDENNPVFIIKDTYKKLNNLILNNIKPKLDEKYKFNKKEIDLIIELSSFKNIIKTITKTYKIQLLPQYVVKICNLFNSIINLENYEINNKRILIFKSFKNILFNSLKLLEISTN